MKKVLFIIPYPEGEAASQRFRFEQYLALMKNAGIDYRLSPFLDSETWKVLYKSGFLITKIKGSSLVGTPLLVVSGNCTSSPCCIIGAVTMKIINNTNMTSTSGVTLISLSTVREPLLGVCPEDILLTSEEIALGQIQKVRGKVIECELLLFNARDKHIVTDARGNGRGESDSGGNQSLGDTRRNYG